MAMAKRDGLATRTGGRPSSDRGAAHRGPVEALAIVPIMYYNHSIELSVQFGCCGI